MSRLPKSASPDQTDANEQDPAEQREFEDAFAAFAAECLERRFNEERRLLLEMLRSAAPECVTDLIKRVRRLDAEYKRRSAKSFPRGSK